MTGPVRRHAVSRTPQCQIVPPYVLEALLASGDAHLQAHARRTLSIDAGVRSQRVSLQGSGGVRTPPTPPTAAHRAPGVTPPVAPPSTAPAPRTSTPATPSSPGAAVTGRDRTIYDAGHGSTLPGTRIRREGDPAGGDTAVNEAYDGLGDTFDLYDVGYGRRSLDGKGLPLVASVHYGTGYDNAFWDGSQMVFGDGDGTIFLGFTRSIDVIGHELTHGVTQYTANLAYSGESGALNESISDVFGVLVKQRVLGQGADQADWLIGAELLAPGVNGVALRSMKAPGTAYDDPRLGKDPQPATMGGYVYTSSDNGGVHANSGIPNHAFYLAATAIGGNAWEVPGQIWYDVLTGPNITVDCDFETFANLTYAATVARFGDVSTEALAVADAWSQVGLPVSGASAGGGDGGAPFGVGAGVAEASGSAVGGGAGSLGSPIAPATARVKIRRTGGFAGLVLERTVTLGDLPGHDTWRWQQLFASRRLHEMSLAPTHPDAFCYDVECSEPLLRLSIPEPGLPEDVRLLLERTLEP
jgi:hypothetical protein